MAKLKNDEARRSFLHDYRKWPAWAKVKKLDMAVYRFDLPDGKAIVASEYRSRLYSRTQHYRNHDTFVVYSFLRSPDDTYIPHGTSESELITTLRTDYREVEVPA